MIKLKIAENLKIFQNDSTKIQPKRTRVINCNEKKTKKLSHIDFYKP